MEEVQKRGAGTIKITPLFGAVPDPAFYDAIIEGTGDIANQPIMMQTGRFPTLEAFTVAEWGTPCNRPSKAIWDFFQQSQDAQKEFSSEVKVISVWGTAPAPPGIAFGTNIKPLKTLEDWKGYKIGIYGKWGTKRAAALGAVTVEVPPFQVYEAQQRKITDGNFFDPEMMEANKIYEVVKYYHNVATMFVPFYFVANLKFWNGLPPDVQKIMLDVGALIPDWDDAYHQAAGNRAIDDAKNKYGVEIITIAPDELTRWRQVMEPVRDEYAALLDSKGVNGKQALALSQSMLEKYVQ
jgi:TRAP-type C4-dicarboxylate transport system substrate-binding protein